MDINYKQKLKRSLIIIAVISLLLASALELFTFGVGTDFFGRWVSSFTVFFTLITLTVVFIVPGVSYIINRISGIKY
jgi:thiosulfate reductase cytochrome b subunit